MLEIENLSNARDLEHKGVVIYGINRRRGRKIAAIQNIRMAIKLKNKKLQRKRAVSYVITRRRGEKLVELMGVEPTTC